MSAITEVTMYIDGACSGNPGPGGWAALYIVNTSKGKMEKLTGGCFNPTTNNQMEVAALLEGVKALRYGCHVTVHTDSANLIGWMSQGWKRKDQYLRALLERIEDHCESVGHTLSFVKVQGHSGDLYNDRVDAEACRQRDIAKTIPLPEYEPSPSEY